MTARVGLALTLSFSAQAAQRTWSGLGADAVWYTSANWDSGVPGAADTALFSGSGNGKTAVSLGGGVTNVGVAFSADAAPYTIGSSGETYYLNGGIVSLGAGAASDQTIAATLLLGGTVYLYNNEPSRTLLVNSLTVNASRDLHIRGTGPVTFGKLQRAVANETNDTNYIRVETRLGAPITCTDRMTIGALWNYDYPLILNLAPHTTNIFCRNDWNFTSWNGGTVNGGDGTLLILRQSDPTLQGKFAIQSSTVTMNVQLSGPAGLTCVGGWTRGTLILANPANDFAGAVTLDRGNSIEVPFLAATNTVQPLGKGSALAFSNPLDTSVIPYLPARLRVTGNSPSATDRAFSVDQARATIENAGSGLVTLSGPVTGAGAIVFDGTGSITLSGVRSGGGLTKAGSGTLTLAAVNTYTGVTAVTCGTLAVNAGASLGTGALTLSGGATLSLNPTNAANYSITLPATTISGSARLAVAAPASGTSTVTIPSLVATNATLSVTAADAGASSKIFIGGLADGAATWITLNGGLATYSSANGLMASYPAATNHLATLGSVIPDSPNGAAVIDTLGTGGPDTLATNLTTVALLSQEHSSDALVDFGGGILAANMVRQTNGAGGLTLKNGFLTAKGANTNVAIAGIGTAALATLTDDASTGISSSKTYTHLLDFGTSASNATINGVALTKVSSASGTVGSYGWSGFPSGGTYMNWTDWTNTIPPATGAGLRGLLYDMVYSGANMTLKLTGLTPGAAYELRFFLRTWDGKTNPIERTARYDFLTDAAGAPVATVTFDMNHSDPTAIVVRYVAATSELILKTYGAATTSNPYPGVFGLTNEKLADAPAGLVTGNASLAIVTPGAAPLAVAAALADNGRTTSLIKEGDGTLTLAGPVYHTGGTALNSGVLDLAPTSGVTQTFAGSIGGAGAVAKRGAGSTFFLGANAYSGPTVVSNGILSVADSASLGADTAGTAVLSGGALALGPAQFNSLVFTEPITLAGSGPDGLGALRNDSPSPQQYAFKNIVLSDSATVGGTAPLPAIPYSVSPSSSGRCDLRSGILDFGGHTLTKAGPGAFIVASSIITGVTDTAALDITNGVFGLEAATDLKGSETNTVTVRAGAAFDFYQIPYPFRWSLLFKNQGHLTARSNSATNQNLLTGPVTLDGNAVLDGAFHDTLYGTLSGTGGLIKSAGFTHLMGTNNSYAGNTSVTGGVLLALAARTLPAADFSRVTAYANGTLAVRPAGPAADQTGWSDGEITSLISSGAFAARSASLGFETAYDDKSFSDSWPNAGVAKFGPRKLTLSSGTADLGPVSVYDGELSIPNVTHNLGTYSVTVGADPLNITLSTLRLTGAASLLTTDPGYNRAGPVVSVGAASTSRAVLSIEDSAAVSGRLNVGGSGAQGAVYQSGGSFLSTAGASNEGRVGTSGHGYYELSGGSLTNKGYTQFGYNAGIVGMLRQTGGSFAFNSGSTPATGVVGDYYGGALAVRAGLGLFHLTGGTFTTGASKLSLGEWDANINSGNDCTGVLTVEGTASAAAGYVELANRNGTAISVVNLSGGSLATRYLIKGGNNNSANSRAYVNFNGGNLRVTEGGAPVRTAANNAPASLTVCNGGASIEVDPSATVTLDLPLAASAGLGLGIVNVNSRGAGYIAPPFVNITGGGGTGATAVATIDRVTGEMNGLRITSPGTGYTSVPTVSLVGGGYTSAATVKDITIALNTSTGGLTKCGGGGLVLATNNTFRGAITVAGGTLAARAPGAIPQGADLVLSGGTLDLGGRALTNVNVRIASGGGLVNGSIVTTTLSKEGAGQADLTTAVALAPVAETACTPGLYEGRLNNSNSTYRSNHTDPNPSTSVQLTTRAVNGAYVASGGTINSCVWPDNTCYVYTGYIWNRTGTNAVWTFGENFDDNVYLLIDGRAILDNDASTTATYRNVLLTPGPHAFEVRCGQGSGNVGGNWVQTGGYRLGFGVDYQGRAQNVADNYQPLTDPGNGSLFTIDLPASYRAADVVAAPSTPALPAEVVTNVGALASGYALVYASDIPSSGGVINGSAGGTRYFVDNSRADTNDFDRVAYYVELTHPTYGNQWVWVSFDTVTRDRTLIGYPFHDTAAGSGYCANIGQCKVSRMDVLSNVPGITNYTGCATGNIEFWPNNYSQADALGLGASSSSATNGYDFGDTKSDGVPSAAGHGSFQVHNWGDKTTLFAMGNWGTGNNTISLGIGNQPGSGPLVAPDWTFNYNGAAYTYRRLYVFTRDIVRTPRTPTAVVSEGTLRLQPEAISHPVPDDIRAKVGPVARDFDVVYASSVPVSATTIVSGTAYSIDNSAATAPFDRVAYYLELVNNSVTQYVWVAFNAHTSDRKKLGYPSQTGNLFMWQQKITNMDVVCNVEGVTNYTGSATGNIEIWPSNYSPATSGLGLGGNGGTFDYDDSGASVTAGHGCFQIHNWGDKTTLLAISHLGSSGNQIGTGIGNNPTPSTVPGQTDPDYTFTYNATQYVVRTFYVMVRPTLRGAGASLASVDLTVASGAALDLGGATQTIHSISGAGTVSNGVLAAGTVLSPAGDSAVGTLAFAGVLFASGVQYRANLGDRLDVAGTLNLTGLQLHLINPEALDRAQTYTLIQTTAGISGDPTLDAPLPSGWKLRRRDNALFLLVDGGSILLLK